MDKRNKCIPLFDLPSSVKIGLSVKYNWQLIDGQRHDIYTPHRDTQFILIVVQKGDFSCMLDFEELTIKGPAILLISPGRVHQMIAAMECEVINIDFVPALISAELQDVLSRNFLIRPVLVDPTTQQQVETMASLMHQLFRQPPYAYLSQSVHALLVSILALIANNSAPAQEYQASESRIWRITQQFTSLLQREYKRWKKPSQYAEALSISVSYLNESVRVATGSSVSEHIQQYVVLEAKRLLVFSILNIKEIAFDLGYEDPVYFNRVFKKITGDTPLKFRNTYRD